MSVPKAFDINDWIEYTATFMADNAHKVLREKGYKHGPEVYRALSLLFMARVMASTLIEVIHDRPEGVEGKAAMEHAKRQFFDMKNDVQDIVAMAFTTATAVTLGKPTDFYCQIKVTPEPISQAKN